jgi:hypothetical protein
MFAGAWMVARKGIAAPHALMWWGAAAAIAVAVGVACSEQPGATCAVAGVCDPQNVADSGTAVDTAVEDTRPPPPDAPPLCDLTVSPQVSAACVDDAIGVFVSTAGDDASGDGTRKKPLKSMDAAGKKLGNKVRIYVCNGAYTETVAIVGPISVYGGFDCVDWKPNATQTARFVAVDAAKPARRVYLNILNSSPKRQ